MPTYNLNLQVSQNSDNAYNAVIGGAALLIGSFGGTIFYTGFRFQNVDIPQGATIDSVVLKVRSRGVSDNNFYTEVHAEDSDESDAFSIGNDPSHRTLTTASISWDKTAPWGVGWQDSPEIKSVIQEVVDRPSWISGNAMSVIIKGDAVPSNSYESDVYGYLFGDGSNAAQLIITFTRASSETPSKSTIGGGGERGKKVLVKVHSGKAASYGGGDLSPNKYNTYELWDDASFGGFTKTINGGLGELEINLARPFDNFGYQDDVDFNDRVEIITTDDESGPLGRTVYNGYIAEINPWHDGHNQGVRIKCLGYITKFDSVVITGDTATAPYVTARKSWASKDVSTIVEDILDIVAETSLNPSNSRMDPQFIVKHDASSISSTGQAVDLRLSLKTGIEAIRICQEINNRYSYFYFFLGADEYFYWRKLPDHPTHTFTWQRHVKAIDINMNMLNVANNYYAWNGLQASDPEVARKYHGVGYIDTTEASRYGIRDKVLEIRSTESPVTMEMAIGADYLQNKEHETKASFEILDFGVNSKSGYDIDSIQPGDTCQILNLPPSINDMLPSNMIIKKVDYTLDKVKLEIALTKAQLEEELSGTDFNEKDSRRVEAPAEFEVMV